MQNSKQMPQAQIIEVRNPQQFLAVLRSLGLPVPDIESIEGTGEEVCCGGTVDCKEPCSPHKPAEKSKIVYILKDTSIKHLINSYIRVFNDETGAQQEELELNTIVPVDLARAFNKTEREAFFQKVPYDSVYKTHVFLNEEEMTKVLGSKPAVKETKKGVVISFVEEGKEPYTTPEVVQLTTADFEALKVWLGDVALKS